MHCVRVLQPNNIVFFYKYEICLGILRTMISGCWQEIRVKIGNSFMQLCARIINVCAIKEHFRDNVVIN